MENCHQNKLTLFYVNRHYSITPEKNLKPVEMNLTCQLVIPIHWYRILSRECESICDIEFVHTNQQIYFKKFISYFK